MEREAERRAVRSLMQMAQEVKNQGSLSSEERAGEAISVSVLTVDDQAVFRRAAESVVTATPGFEQCGEAGSGEEAIDAVERLHPDLVLLDVRMPGMGGIEAARRIASVHPRTVVVLITIEDPEQFSKEAQSAGAAGLVRKQDFGSALLRKIWAAHGGTE